MPAIKGTASNPCHGLEECEVCGVVGIGEVCPDCKKLGEDWFDVAMLDYPSLPEFWDDSYPASLVAYDNENLF